MPKYSLVKARLAHSNGRAIAIVTVIDEEGVPKGEQPLVNLLMEEQAGRLEILNHKDILSHIVLSLGFAA